MATTRSDQGNVVRFRHRHDPFGKSKQGPGANRVAQFPSPLQPPQDAPAELRSAPIAKLFPCRSRASARDRFASDRDFSDEQPASSWRSKLHNYQPTSSPELRNALTTKLRGLPYGSAMPATTRIHKGKQPNRPHFIQEWAELRGFQTQADLAKELDADKSVVSRWYSGTSPTVEWQERLSALFDCDREALFRHPDDDWLTKFFRNRDRDEIERAKRMLEAAFPALQRKAG